MECFDGEYDVDYAYILHEVHVASACARRGLRSLEAADVCVLVWLVWRVSCEDSDVLAVCFLFEKNSLFTARNCTGAIAWSRLRTRFWKKTLI